MSESVRLAAIGGFLGSGKTTLIIELGKKLVSELDKVVAIVTNDQGEVLVDTKIVRDFGFACAEVLNGCFCCRFEDFVTSIHEMLAKINPEVILAEPCGSCTDLLATVYAPLRQYYGHELSLAPFTVLVDASTILDYDRKSSLVSPKDLTGSLLSWQIQEAEILGVNKVDLASSKDVGEVESLLRKINDGAEVTRVSAKTGYNLDRLVKSLLAKEHKPRPSIEVDYDMYAAAEAQLGWFNGSWKIVSEHPLRLSELVQDLIFETSKRIEGKGGQVVHLKLSFSTSEGSAKASLVLRGEYMDFTGEIPPPSNTVEIIMNIRANLDPESLTECVQDALKAVTSKFNTRYTDWFAKSFRPSFPKPCYRLLHTQDVKVRTNEGSIR